MRHPWASDLIERKAGDVSFIHVMYFLGKHGAHSVGEPYIENIAEVAVRGPLVMKVKGWSAHDAVCQMLLKKEKEMT